MIMLLFFGTVSGVVAIPLSIATGYAYAGFVARILNFEIMTRYLPPDMYAYLITASLLLPVVFSLPILARGTGVSVKEALSDYGIGVTNKPAAVAFMKLPFNGALNMAVRNAMRKTRRFAVTVLALALGVAIFNTGFNVRQSLLNLLNQVQQTQKYDVQVALNEQIPREKALSLFRSLDNLEKMEFWNGGRGELQSRMIRADNGIGIVSLPTNSTIIHPAIAEGRWLKMDGRHEIALNQKAIEALNSPAVGKDMELSINGRKVLARLAGVIEEFDKPKIYMADTFYDALANPDHRVNSLMFVAKKRSYREIMALKKDIEKIIVTSDLKVMFVMSQAERVKVIYDHLNIILSSIIFLASLVLVVSAIGMSSSIGMTILERTREIGVMKAIGATPGKIYKLFIAEGMVISAFGIALGVLIAWPLSRGASIFFGKLILGEGAVLKYAFSISGFVITLITTFVFSVVASRIPAGSAVKLTTRKALSYE
jgi:putative ABC transport system permease protein